VSAPGEGRSGWKGKLFLTLKTVLSLALLAFLLVRIPAREVMATLRAADPFWLWAAAGLLLASNLLGSFQWSRLLRAVEIRIPFWKVAAYYHVGLFFNNFLPANVGGDLARTLDVARSGVSRSTALSTVLLDRLIGTVALGSIAVVSTIPAIDHFHLAAAYGGVVAFFTAALLMLRAVLEPRVLASLERVLAMVGLSRFAPALDAVSARLATFRGQRRLMLELFGVALVVQILRILVHVLFARALGLHVPVTYFFLFVPLVAVIVSLPISLNGIGVREGAGILLFGLVGLDRGSAFALQFGTYLVAVGVSLIGGLVFLVRIPSRRALARNPRRSSE
jgi:glycosyltransferase 2 family protein